MKYQTYPEYKDSGVEWLGKIPGHWDRLKFSLLADAGKAFASGPFGSSRGSQFYQDSGIPVIRGNNLSINGNKPLFNDNGYVFLTEEKADELANAEVRPGDLIFTARGTVGQIGLVPDDGSVRWSRAILSANQLRFRKRRNGINTKYFWYLFSSWLMRTQILLSSDSVAQPNLNLGSLKALNVLLPSSNEQNQIANFLDHETAKIDTLIEKQQQLIALLKEKRQAVISHAVTKGLNPDAPMKDSGVEWLGEVPEHWEVVKFSHCASIRTGQVDPRVAPYKDYILIAPNHIESQTGKLLALETAAEQGADSGKYLCSKGEVIYSKIRPALAKVCLSPGNDVICSADMYPIQGKDGLINKFLFWTFISDWFTSFTILESDRVAMPKINREKLAEVKLLFPPNEEQNLICQYIEERTSTVDSLLAKAEQSIKLAIERRTALISAAVTGKIDVRNWQPPTDKDIQ